MALKKRVWVEQWQLVNGRFMSYWVIKTQNITEPRINSEIKESEVKRLIERGIDVTILPHKG